MENILRMCSRVNVDLIIFLLVVAELLLCALIVLKVPYTEIDWKAYMQEVEGYLSGERNYYNLGGDTGPLVYPAGFVYVFVALRAMTDNGLNIFKAIDVAVVAAALQLYKKGKGLNWFWWPILLLSKRIHSIFVLRLFNDCIAVLFGYWAICLFVSRKWRFGCFLYSFAVSIKMNMLLYSPGILLVLLLGSGLTETIVCLSICAVVQLILGFPFLSTYPIAYLTKSFELGRVFMFKWTVNFKFIHEEIFISKEFSLALLCLTVVGFICFGYKWVSACRESVTISGGFKKGQSLTTIIGGNGADLSPHFVIVTLFISNFIGVALARSLHYQFYCWYFFSLPYLLWHTALPIFFKLLILGGIEYAFNIFPATATSSLILQCCHALLLVGLFVTPVPKPFQALSSDKQK